MEALGVKGVTDGTHAAVHHVAWAHHVSTCTCLHTSVEGKVYIWNTGTQWLSMVVLVAQQAGCQNDSNCARLRLKAPEQETMQIRWCGMLCISTATVRQIINSKQAACYADAISTPFTG